MQCFMILAIVGTEIKKLKYFTRREILTKWLVEFVKDNYYARFHDPSYQRYRERQLRINTRRKILARSMELEM